MLYTIADFVARHAIAVLTRHNDCDARAVRCRVAHARERGSRARGRSSSISGIALGRRGLRSWLGKLPILGRALSGTLTIARYLGIVAIVGFAVSAGAIVLFFELADEIGAGESLAEFDVALSAALHEHLSLETLRVFSIITRLGDGEVLFAIGVVAFAVLAAKRLRLLAAAWVVTTLSGALLNRILKAIFERSRPLHDHGLTAEEGWSFPSGHASGSMLVYGLLAYVVVRNTPSTWHVPAALAGIALVIFVGSSRVLLQVHYLSDVLAGYASATAWIAICIAALETVRWRERLG